MTPARPLCPRGRPFHRPRVAPSLTPRPGGRPFHAPRHRPRRPRSPSQPRAAWTEKCKNGGENVVFFDF